MKYYDINNILQYSHNKIYVQLLELSRHLLYIFKLNYGYLSNNKLVIINNFQKQFKEFKQNYKYLSPEDINKFNIGICFDAVNYIYSLLKINIKIGKFYLMFIFNH